MELVAKIKMIFQRASRGNYGGVNSVGWKYPWKNLKEIFELVDEEICARNYETNIHSV